MLWAPVCTIPNNYYLVGAAPTRQEYGPGKEDPVNNMGPSLTATAALT